MIKKLVLTALALLIPTLACAGLVNIYVTSGSGSGSASKGGYFATAKFVNFSSNTAAGYALTKVTNNGATVVTTPVNATHATYSVPLSSATQTLKVTFTQAAAAIPAQLVAVVPAAVNVQPGIGQVFSGVGSTVKYATAPTFNFAGPAAVTFTPSTGAATSPGNIVTTITSATVGTYNCTMTLHATNDGTSGLGVSTSFQVIVGVPNACDACHAGWPASVAFPSSIHGQNGVTCTDCHIGNHPATAASAGQMTCTPCHSDAGIVDPNAFDAQLNNCQRCHTPPGLEPFHAFQNTSTALTAGGTKKDSCVFCHSIQVTHPGNFIEDNQGVRAITPEFAKTSHHIVNASGGPLDAQCVACHAEGKVVGGVVRVNTAIHMHADEIYLRNGGGISQAQLAKELGGNKSTVGPDGVTSVFMWDPNTPNHNLMDQFCMSCHNANGAPLAAAAIVGAQPTSTATNPFGDLVKSTTDGVSRVAVVNVFSQYSTGNNSHHAVRGKKYSGSVRAATTGRTTVATPAAFTTYSGAAVSPIFATQGTPGLGSGLAVVASRHTNSNAGIGPASPGSRHTLYEAGYFTAAYVPLGATASVADDSVLHCGDCHTVGQWKPGSTTDANGVATTAAIGAHGSVNEYMLRTASGIDAIHVNAEYAAEPITPGNVNNVPAGTPWELPYNMAKGIGGPVRPTGGSLAQTNAGENTYVCFLCHKQSVYGATEAVPFTANPTLTYGETRMGGHGGLHPCNDPVDGESTGKTGSARLNFFSGGELGGGNLFGYTCANCHNAGNKGFGGIHGSNATYGNYSSDGTWAANGNTDANIKRVNRPTYRFMGGLSLKYSGGATAAKWESQVLQKSNREGCYNFTVNGDALSSTGSSTGGGNALTPGTAGGIKGVDFTGAATSNAVPGAAATQWRTDTTSSNAEFTDGTGGAAIFGTWGACGHHNGSTTAGANATSLRKVQRPLKY